MADKPIIPIETLRQLLAYDPETGLLTWLHRPENMFATKKAFHIWNTRFAGQEAFTYISDGYRTGRLFGRGMKAHRVAYALHHGAWPDTNADVDHINGNRADNRIANLRAVDRQTNLQNTKRRKDNSSGVPGVYWVPRCKLWTARLSTRSLGYFKTFEEACEARRAEEIEHGYHPNHGRSA